MTEDEMKSAMRAIKVAREQLALEKEALEIGKKHQDDLLKMIEKVFKMSESKKQR